MANDHVISNKPKTSHLLTQVKTLVSRYPLMRHLSNQDPPWVFREKISQCLTHISSPGANSQKLFKFRLKFKPKCDCKSSTLNLRWTFGTGCTDIALVQEPFVYKNRVQGMNSKLGSVLVGTRLTKPRACMLVSNDIQASLLQEFSNQDQGIKQSIHSSVDLFIVPLIHPTQCQAKCWEQWLGFLNVFRNCSFGRENEVTHLRS
jgi:hypothetical protein